MCMQLLMLYVGYMLEEVLSLTSSGYLFIYLFMEGGGFFLCFFFLLFFFLLCACVCVCVSR